VDLLASEKGITVVGEASDGESAVRIAHDDEPDVMVVDLRMSDVDGIEVTRRISSGRPSVSVVILTAHEDADFGSRAVQAGAKACVLKTAEDEELLQTLRMVAGGHTVLNADTLNGAEHSDPNAAMTDVALTARELEVLRLAARGLTNRQIGTHLGLSRETIKTHVVKIFRRLGVADRTEAVALAIRSGLLE
jgi:DNA-binding NarL/FixJ family response regulator